MISGNRILKDFFLNDVLDVAPELLGKNLVTMIPDGNSTRFIITEVEAYRGVEDKACHAYKGRTKRTEIMFHEGGYLYVYLIYGIHWMLNVVTGPVNNPQAVLIRGVKNYSGPGRVSKLFGIDGTFYGEDLNSSDRIWFEENGERPEINSGPRIGIDYAGDYWKSRPWRFYI